MTTTLAPGMSSTASRAEQTFPTLTSAQVTRIAAHGHVRSVERGEVLCRVGDHPPFFVVTSGELQIVRPTEAG